VGAGLVAAAIHADLRALLRTSHIADAFAQLNEQLLAQSSPLYACVAAVEMSEGEVTIVNAGMPPVCTGSRGTVRAAVQASGVPPGMFSGERYELRTLPIQRGERVALMSDGLVEPFGNADEVLGAVEALGLFDAAQWQEGDPLSASDRVQRWMSHAPTEVRDDATLLLLEADL